MLLYFAHCAKYHNIAILCLQETNLPSGHAKQGEIEDSLNHFSYTPFWGFKRSEDKSGGTVILVKTELCKSMNVVQKTVTNMFGGASKIELSINNNTYSILNVYAPQTKRESFFHDLNRHCNNKTFMCGDMNCTVDPALDVISQSKSPYNNAGGNGLNSLIHKHNLFDSFRIEQGLTFDYTKKLDF